MDAGYWLEREAGWLLGSSIIRWGIRGECGDLKPTFLGDIVLHLPWEYGASKAPAAAARLTSPAICKAPRRRAVADAVHLMHAMQFREIVTSETDPVAIVVGVVLDEGRVLPSRQHHAMPLSDLLEGPSGWRNDANRMAVARWGIAAKEAGHIGTLIVFSRRSQTRPCLLAQYEIRTENTLRPALTQRFGCIDAPMGTPAFLPYPERRFAGLSPVERLQETERYQPASLTVRCAATEVAALS